MLFVHVDQGHFRQLTYLFLLSTLSTNPYFVTVVHKWWLLTCRCHRPIFRCHFRQSLNRNRTILDLTPSLCLRWWQLSSVAFLTCSHCHLVFQLLSWLQWYSLSNQLSNLKMQNFNTYNTCKLLTCTYILQSQTSINSKNYPRAKQYGSYALILTVINIIFTMILGLLTTGLIVGYVCADPNSYSRYSTSFRSKF